MARGEFQERNEVAIITARRELGKLDQFVRDYSDAISGQVDSAAVLLQISEALRDANVRLESGLSGLEGRQL